ncbi:hypothetical protein [Salinisphaera sp. LB1]|uniref:hypothetical protein n=1 Tax=Salinisphaera sp. LB1 TaxID=2183911 RepID=UPI000D7D825B|nr:hypothetical protein [Salinisphaera sp. LB1]AWN16213.1 hypothetical protein SALB1_2015 [Salinisphaera sp. LB1]
MADLFIAMAGRGAAAAGRKSPAAAIDAGRARGPGQSAFSSPEPGTLWQRVEIRV